MVRGQRGKEKELGRGGQTEKRQKGKKYAGGKKERGNVEKSFKKRGGGRKASEQEMWWKIKT